LTTRLRATITFLIVSAFFMYRLFVVAYAFAGRLRDIRSFGGHHFIDYLVLEKRAGVKMQGPYDDDLNFIRVVR